MSDADQLSPYGNIAICVQLLYDAILFVLSRTPESLDRVTTNPYSLCTQPNRKHYEDQLFEWMAVLFIKQESLTEAEQLANQREFARILDACHVILRLLNTRLNTGLNTGLNTRLNH